MKNFLILLPFIMAQFCFGTPGNALMPPDFLSPNNGTLNICTNVNSVGTATFTLTGRPGTPFTTTITTNVSGVSISPSTVNHLTPNKTEVVTVTVNTAQLPQNFQNPIKIKLFGKSPGNSPFTQTIYFKLSVFVDGETCTVPPPPEPPVNPPTPPVDPPVNPPTPPVNPPVDECPVCPVCPVTPVVPQPAPLPGGYEPVEEKPFDKRIFHITVGGGRSANWKTTLTLKNYSPVQSELLVRLHDGNSGDLKRFNTNGNVTESFTVILRPFEMKTFVFTDSSRNVQYGVGTIELMQGPAVSAVVQYSSDNETSNVVVEKLNWHPFTVEYDNSDNTMSSLVIMNGDKNSKYGVKLEFFNVSGDLLETHESWMKPNTELMFIVSSMFTKLSNTKGFVKVSGDIHGVSGFGMTVDITSLRVNPSAR